MILIKGMEMPENCHECEFIDILPTCPCNKMADDDFWNNVSLAVEGHKDCPLIGVPPHGRLIDADALLADVRAHSETYFADDFAHEWVDVAPTVIPADKDSKT